MEKTNILNEIFNSNLYYIIYFFFLGIFIYYSYKFYAVAELQFRYFFFLIIMYSFLNFLSELRKKYFITENLISKLKIAMSEENVKRE